MELAEIHALSRRASERREELGRTLAALHASLTSTAYLRGLAEAAAEWAAAHIRHAVAHAIRTSAPATGAAALTAKVVDRTRAAGPGKTAAVGIPAAGALAAGSWLLWRRVRSRAAR
jgi:Ser/Thr protein kinase RdoA (MazF antagonist)